MCHQKVSTDMKQKLSALATIFVIICSLFSCGIITPDDEIEMLKENVLSKDWVYIESDDYPLTEYYYPTEMMQYADDCIYLFNRLTDDTVTLVRLNQKNGSVTSVCADPLCDHKSISCPFGGNISGICIYNDTIYYWRMFTQKNAATGEYDKSIRQFCSYDLNNMKFTVHIEKELPSGVSSGQYMKMLFDGDYCYFYDYEYYSDTDTYQWQLKKMNVKSSKVSLVSKVDNSVDFPAEVYLFIVDGRIYFKSPDEIYSTNMELEDRKTHIKGKFLSEDIYTNGQYIFYSVLDESGVSETIHRADLDGSNIINLGISSTLNWRVTSKYIYYFEPNYKTVPAGKDGYSINLFFDSIYRCDFEGKNRECVVSMNWESGTYYQLTDIVVAGNYIYAGYYVFDDVNKNGMVDKDEHSSDSSAVIRIDMTEHKYEVIMK